jgi:hypothetical protein
MIIGDFTVEEINIIAIYLGLTRAETIANIEDALPDMDDEMITMAEGASRKLTELNERDFSAPSFTLTDEDEGDGYE